MSDGGPGCEVTGRVRSRAAEIGVRARERNRARSAELGSWVQTARTAGLTDRERTVAADVAHQLAGSAGTFGYQHATEIAWELEKLIAEGDSEQDWCRAAACVAEIVASLDRDPDLPDDDADRLDEGSGPGEDPTGRP